MRALVTLLAAAAALVGATPATPATPAASAAPVARAGASTRAPVPCAGRHCWHPEVGDTFFWQLAGTVRAGRRATIYDIDSETTPRATVAALHRHKRKVVCYISGGSFEEYRGDASAFPAAVLGEQLDGWPDERWLDIRQLHILAPIMRARMAACRAKGFDGIEFDNVDGYTQKSGFDITAADQLRYNRWLADEAHRHGLAAGLKNDPDQVTALVRWFDFAVVEQCFQYSECAKYTPFIRAYKPVFDAEYVTPLRTFCVPARRLRIEAARYPLALNGAQSRCP